MQISKMFTEYLENPIGIDISNLRFSWTLNGECEQLSYDIQVKKADEPIWNSGIVKSSELSYSLNDAIRFESNCDYTWTLTIYDQIGAVHQKTSNFSTGLLKTSDWSAKWIGKRLGDKLTWDENAENIFDVHDALKDKTEVQSRSVLLRNEHRLNQKPKRAFAYVCGLGLNEFYINGEKVGDKVLNPLVTDYSKRVLYDTYDITKLLDCGLNAICIELGNGWYCPQKKYWDWRMKWYGNPRAIIQIHIEFYNGQTDVILSDESWKISDGPVMSSCIYDGESYDAREEKLGWKSAGYDDASWNSAVQVEAPCERLVSNIYPPMKVNEVLAPIGVTNPFDGVTVYDFGKNVPGWVRLSLKGKRGTKVTIRHAEFIDDSGMLNTKTNRSALNTDTYILKGEEVECYEPRFTCHGFRYVEITAEPQMPEILSIHTCVVYSAVGTAGRFTCDNEFINRLHEVIVNTQCGALMGVPVDCPQRDERLGWLGDAHITADVCLYNFNMAMFYKKWLNDIKFQQHTVSGDIPHIAPRPGVSGAPDWSSAYSIIVWHFYRYYGDESILKEHYEPLKRYAEYLKSQSPEYIYPKGRYGDWMTVVEGWTRGEPEHTNTLYFYYNVINLIRMAKVLKKADDLAYYTDMAVKIKIAVTSKFYNAEKKVFGDGTQYSNAFALMLGLIPKEDEQAVVENLVYDIEVTNKGHLTTGILGTKYLIEVLTKFHREDVAYNLVLKEGFPGWAYLIDGVTTLFETWDRKGSGNHCMFGSVDAWFYRTLAGINPVDENPGFEKVIIRPYLPNGLNSASAMVNTVKGEIKSKWVKAQDKITFEISLPLGVKGEFWLDTRLGVRQVIRNGKIVLSKNEDLNETERYFVLDMQTGANIFEVISFN